MPQIFEFYCTDPDCEFEMPSGWGYYMYATADDGDRVHCPHPGEMGRAREVIGEDASQKEIDVPDLTPIASASTVKRR